MALTEKGHGNITQYIKQAISIKDRLPGQLAKCSKKRLLAEYTL